MSYFHENNLSETQKVEEIEDEWFITATTGDLRWWLLSYGDKVEVISPASLRTEITMLLMNTMNQYLDNRIFTEEDKTLQLKPRKSSTDIGCRETRECFLHTLDGLDKS